MAPVVLLLLLLGQMAIAPSTAVAQERVETTTRVTITLHDGSVLKGNLVSEDETLVVIETVIGRTEVPRDRISLIERMDDRGVRSFEGSPDPDTNTIFFTPTTETIGEGAYFRNFLLFFLNWGHSVHEDLDLSVGTVFPLSSDLFGLSAGFKWRLASRADHPLGLAVLANGTIIDDHRSATFGGVIGAGNDDKSFNVAVGRYVDDDDESSTLILIGADVRVGARTKFLVEYGSSSEVIDADVPGLINLGFRWYGERISFSLTGFRPLEDTGSFVAFPFTMFSMHF